MRVMSRKPHAKGVALSEGNFNACYGKLVALYTHLVAEGYEPHWGKMDKKRGKATTFHCNGVKYSIGKSV